MTDAEKASHLTAKWIDLGYEPKSPPNPRYPNGIDIDISAGASKTCMTSLPHPTARCGYYSILCERCGFTAIVTTAGRADDPRSVRIPCKSFPGTGC